MTISPARRLREPGSWRDFRSHCVTVSPTAGVPLARYVTRARSRPPSRPSALFSDLRGRVWLRLLGEQVHLGRVSEADVVIAKARQYRRSHPISCIGREVCFFRLELDVIA